MYTNHLTFLLIIQLNLAILDEFIDNKSPFYDYLLNIDRFLRQGLIGGAIYKTTKTKTSRKYTNLYNMSKLYNTKL